MLLTSSPCDLEDLPRPHRRPALTHYDLPGHALLSRSLTRPRRHHHLARLSRHRAGGHQPWPRARQTHLRPRDRSQLLRGHRARRPLQRDGGRVRAHDPRLRLAGADDGLGADHALAAGAGGGAGDVLGGAAHGVAGGDAAEDVLEGGAEDLAALRVGDLLELLRGQGGRRHRPWELDGVAAKVDLEDR